MYSGDFGSRDGVQWHVEIVGGSGTGGKLSFPKDEPLLIEWSETSKEEPVCGSIATLRVLSPGDRTYEHLYTTEAGQTGLDVYRNGELYWSGTLDPEFYEEPYTDMKDYEVELVFSDFGILDRLSWQLTGMPTLREIVDDALARSGMNPLTGIDETLISSSLDGGRLTLSALCVRDDNFIDEDGKGMTLREVLEGILQPLGLRMVQRCGKLWIYDLNGLYQGGGSKAVKWMSTDQMLGVDKVVNNAKVTFSPYGQNPLLDGKTDCNPGASTESHDISSGWRSWTEDRENIDLTVWVSPDGGGVADSGRGYFKIEPVLGGMEETDGVLGGFKYVSGIFGNSSPVSKLVGRDFASTTEEKMLVTKRVRLSGIDQSEADGLYLRLQLELLVDGRYNPWSNDSESDDNWQDAQDTLDEDWSYLFVPVSLVVYDDNGVAKQHWTNRSIANSRDGQPVLTETTGRWESGGGSLGDAWLEYYDPSDRKHSSGTGGWQTNRQCIGMTNKALKRSLTARKAGQYLPFPSEGGWLEVTVWGGLWPYKDIHTAGLTLGQSRHEEQERQLREQVRWCLYKAPRLEVVNTKLTNDVVKAEDVEYSGVINPSAREDLELETICGTMETVNATARGLLFKTASKKPLTELSRAGRTTQAEQLLIGTLYSQYGERHTTLSGTVEILSDGLCVYTEKMQGGRRFMALEDVQDVEQDSSEVRLCELSPDEWDGEQADAG